MRRLVLCIALADRFARAGTVGPFSLRLLERSLFPAPGCPSLHRSRSSRESPAPRRQVRSVAAARRAATTRGSRSPPTHGPCRSARERTCSRPSKRSIRSRDFPGSPGCRSEDSRPSAARRPAASADAYDLSGVFGDRFHKPLWLESARLDISQLGFPLAGELRRFQITISYQCDQVSAQVGGKQVLLLASM